MEGADDTALKEGPPGAEMTGMSFPRDDRLSTLAWLIVGPDFHRAQVAREALPLVLALQPMAVTPPPPVVTLPPYWVTERG